MKATKTYSKKSTDLNSSKTSNLFVQGIIEGIKDLTDLDFEHYVNVKLDFSPKNLFSDVAYKRYNSVALIIDVLKKHYTISKYATFQQIKEAGGKIKKNSKSVPLYYFNFVVKNIHTGEKITIEKYRSLSKEDQDQYDVSSYTKHFRVFNINCIENIDELNILDFETIKEENKFDSNIEAESFIQQLQDERGLILNFDLRSIACYNWGEDRITSPMREYYTDAEMYYTTLFHEIIHWTAHKSRMDRELSQDMHIYSNEELIAEIGSMLLAQQFNFQSQFINSLKYLRGWIGSIKDEDALEKKLSEAFRQASKALSYLGR